MSVAEIIEQIKTLPPEEVAAVREFLTRTDMPGVSSDEFEQAAERVFSKHDQVLRELAK